MPPGPEQFKFVPPSAILGWEPIEKAVRIK